MMRPLHIAFPGTIYQTTSRENARAAIDADAADRAALLLLLTGRDKVTLVDKERAYSALSTRRRGPGLSSNVSLVPAAEAVHSHGSITQW